MTGAGGVIDQFFVALGYKVDPKGIDEFQKKTESAKDSILNFGNALKVFATGFVARSIAKIGSDFEQNQIAIAGFLSTLKISPNFEAGLQDASDVIKQITIDAAKLPGEAEEYIEVFRAALPMLKRALPGGSLRDLTDFTNQITAVGKTLNIDAPQIGRDLSLMLSGHAGAQVRTFRELLPFIQTLPGQANLSAEAFNGMSASARAALLQQTLGVEGLQKMLTASAGSFDAMSGAVMSMVKQVTRAVTGPLFNAMKQGLDAINAAVFNSTGQLTEFGQGLVDGGKRVISFAVNLVKAAGSIVLWIGKIPGLLTVVKFALRPVLAMLAGSQILKAVAGITKLAKAMLVFKGATMGSALVLGGLAIALALVAEDVYGFFNGIDSVTGVLVEKWGPAIYVVIATLGALGVALGAVVVAQNVAAIQMAIGWAVAAAPLVALLAGMAMLAGAIDNVTKHWEVFKTMMTDLPLAKLKDHFGSKEGFFGFGAGIHESEARAKMGRQLEADDERDKFNAMGPKQEGYDGNKAFNAMGPFQDESQYKGASSLVWQKFEQTPPAGVSGGNTQTNITHVTGTQINVKSTDPAAAAKETAREVTRLGQAKRAY